MADESRITGKQYLRKAGLMLVQGEKALDLSQFQFRFQTVQQDEESPNNCSIRVYNLKAETVRKVRKEYSRVVLQAGYEGTAFGVIFDGTIKQFREGRENNITTYLDILAADGDIAYNWSIVNQSLAAGSSFSDRVNAITGSMKGNGVDPGKITYPDTGGILPRGKVLFGYAKAAMREQTQTMGSTWNISNGKLNVIPLDGYLPGEAVILTSRTGLISRPEQTQDGIRARCLLNPRIVVGGTVRINNKSINQTVAAPGQEIPGGQLAYNQYAGFQRFATVASDGLYRVYVAEHVGNTRGTEWYTDLICLTVNPVTEKVKPYG